jgi:hypothetical protein
MEFEKAPGSGPMRAVGRASDSVTSKEIEWVPGLGDSTGFAMGLDLEPTTMKDVS